MKHSIGFMALALALSTGALADERNPSMQVSTTSAEDALKSSLHNPVGFAVDSSHAGDGGVTCITYHVGNESGGKSHHHAIVDGDKVQREAMGDDKFARAWNEKCAKK